MLSTCLNIPSPDDTSVKLLTFRHRRAMEGWENTKKILGTKRRVLYNYSFITAITMAFCLYISILPADFFSLE